MSIFRSYAGDQFVKGITLAAGWTDNERTFLKTKLDIRVLPQP
jgi:hypothetical protein